MGRSDNKWEDLTKNGKSRQKMGSPDKKWEDLKKNGKN
jgi:hypothetical protein